MRKIVVTCPCGQRMQVSRSAYGKIGVCPKCNQKIRVGANGLEPLALPSPDGPPAPAGHTPQFQFQERQNIDVEIQKRKFAKAVDLFYHVRYAEALAILDELRKDLPGNIQVETARARCLDALNTPKAEPACGAAVPPAQAQETNAPQPSREPPAELTPQAVHQTVLYLMTSGSTDSVRLQAAELASRILGLGPAPDARDKPDVFFARFAPSNGKSTPHSHIHEEPAASLKP